MHPPLSIATSNESSSNLRSRMSISCPASRRKFRLDAKTIACYLFDQSLTFHLRRRMCVLMAHLFNEGSGVLRIKFDSAAHRTNVSCVRGYPHLC